MGTCAGTGFVNVNKPHFGFEGQTQLAVGG